MSVPVPRIPLASGPSIPQLGLGTARMHDGETAAVVRSALELGYRLIDTAENYGNEAGVGRGLRDSGVPREDVFVTSKFNRAWHSVDGVGQAWENSVRRLGLDYLDLFLVHWPIPWQDRYVQAWEGLIRLREEGKVRAVGVSNFTPTHLRRIIAATGVVPDVNQIQLSPYWTQEPARAFHRERGIVTESWTPLGLGRDLLRTPAVAAAAEEHGVTPAQAVLRWHVQQGLVVIPKSAHPERQAENLDVFGFELTDQEMAAISALDGTGPRASDPESTGH